MLTSDVVVWKCNICDGLTLIKENGSLQYCGCKENAHREFENNSISTETMKCLICRRTSFTDKQGNIHDGCTVFKSTQKKIASFHEICLSAVGVTSDEVINQHSDSVSEFY